MGNTETQAVGEGYLEETAMLERSRRRLGFSYPCYRDMYDNNVVFAFKGVVNSDVVTHVLDIMNERLEEDHQSRKTSKKVFNVLVECMTNLYVDEDKSKYAEFDPTAILTVKKRDEQYIVSTGSMIQNNRVHQIKELISRLNKMSDEDIKSYYQEMLLTSDLNDPFHGNLGIIDLARKSKNNLEVAFKYISQDFSFFSLDAYIMSEHTA
jgi:hypothetical protein